MPYASNNQPLDCYAELLPWFKVDPIPEQVVGKTFPVKAYLSASALASLPDTKNVSSMIVSARIYGYGFDINNTSPVIQDIAKADGTWGWELTAKNAGKDQKISFEVAILQNGYQIQNCVPKQSVDVNNIPWKERTLEYLRQQWIGISGVLLGLYNLPRRLRRVPISSSPLEFPRIDPRLTPRSMVCLDSKDRVYLASPGAVAMYMLLSFCSNR